MDRPSFPHSRLDVYRVALRLAANVRRVARAFPRGNSNLADQLERAAVSTVLLIAEGANRRSWPDKRNRYAQARGECGEAAAAIELSCALELIEESTALGLLEDASRVSSMLLSLERRHPPTGPPA